MGKIKYNFIIILQHFHETPSCMYVCVYAYTIYTPAHSHELFTYCVHYEMYNNKIKKRRSITNDQLVDIIVINNFLVFTRNL